ncbi:hypothetical protein NKI56_03985 [Mesorhizobium sp. M0622]|uniref:type I restriction endonuclease n=1 Tax=Mesorhizobium sp. M0622 TaxID=2956975 RepID=UPI00333970F3
MIARITRKKTFTNPVFEKGELRSESDVEQKLIYPFLTNVSYLNIPSAWVRTKEYMSPTEIDKAAGKRFGYFPDYSVWLGGLPLMIVEAKEPDVTVETGLREARLYAGEINRRYPPEVNPIGYVLASNGEQIALSEWDSETNVLIALAKDIRSGTAVLQAFIGAVGKTALEERARKLAPHFAARRFFAVSTSIGGQSKMTRQLGVNEFAEPLFPVLTKYFDNTSDTPDEVIDRAYVSSEELTTYEGILETYLKDRTVNIGGSQLKSIETSRHTAASLTTEVQKFAGQPSFYSRVQIIVGAVGSGKSTFIRRYYRHLMTEEVREKTIWSFINFNDTGPDIPDVNRFVAEKFLESLGEQNGYDFFDEEQLDKIFAPDISRFERGHKSLLRDNPADYATKLSDTRDSLTANPEKFSEAVARHYAGERGQGLVVVFDNVDKRSRDQQLKIFESAQWFKSLTKGLILVNLRDSTFEAHKDEPPLDAFINAINFYIKPPRFAQVIRKRLELVLENLPAEVDRKQEYALASGYRIQYPSSRLGEFLMSIYLSLFDSKEVQVASTLEALVAKDVRRALGMFSDILVSPHVPTAQITGAAIAGSSFRIPERHILRSLMRGRYQYYNGRSIYIHDIMSADDNHVRPSNFIFCDILEYLVRNRKGKIDFNQEGYATIGTVVKQMGRLGYDDQDALDATLTLVEKGLIEPEALISTDLGEQDAVRVHASGFVHDRILLRRDEYVTGTTTSLKVASKDVADYIGSIWSGTDPNQEMSMRNKVRILAKLRDYYRIEYSRRCRRHPFYEEAGFGGRHMVQSIEIAHDFLDGLRNSQPARTPRYRPR